VTTGTARAWITAPICLGGISTFTIISTPPTPPSCHPGRCHRQVLQRRCCIHTAAVPTLKPASVSRESASLCPKSSPLHSRALSKYHSLVRITNMISSGHACISTLASAPRGEDLLLSLLTGTSQSQHLCSNDLLLGNNA